MAVPGARQSQARRAYRDRQEQSAAHPGRGRGLHLHAQQRSRHLAQRGRRPDLGARAVRGQRDVRRRHRHEPGAHGVAVLLDVGFRPQPHQRVGDLPQHRQRHELDAARSGRRAARLQRQHRPHRAGLRAVAADHDLRPDHRRLGAGLHRARHVPLDRRRRHVDQARRRFQLQEQLRGLRLVLRIDGRPSHQTRHGLCPGGGFHTLVRRRRELGHCRVGDPHGSARDLDRPRRPVGHFRRQRRRLLPVHQRRRCRLVDQGRHPAVHAVLPDHGGPLERVAADGRHPGQRHADVRRLAGLLDCGVWRRRILLPDRPHERQHRVRRVPEHVGGHGPATFVERRCGRHLRDAVGLQQLRSLQLGRPVRDGSDQPQHPAGGLAACLQEHH